MNWRENGEALRTHWRERTMEGLKQKLTPSLAGLMESLPEPGPGMSWEIDWYDRELNPDFVEALKKSSEHDMTSLADYLASNKPLGRKERDRLARMLPKERKMGRPQNTQLRAAAHMASMFYKSWRAANKEMGISDHGHCKAMKDYSTQWMVEDWFYWGSGGEELTEDNRIDFVASVRELIEKPKHLRDGWESGLITFPAFGWEPKTTKTRG